MMHLAAKTYTGWHFLPADRRMQWPLERFGEAIEGPLVEPGKTYEVSGPVEVCAWGLHACRRAIDALNYAPGTVVCRVTLSGDVVVEGDKAAATKRTVHWMADASRVLHEFALWCAETVMEHHGSDRLNGIKLDSDRRELPLIALRTKRRWLDGKASDYELEMVRDELWQLLLELSTISTIISSRNAFAKTDPGLGSDVPLYLDAVILATNRYPRYAALRTSMYAEAVMADRFESELGMDRNAARTRAQNVIGDMLDKMLLGLKPQNTDQTGTARRSE